MVIGTLDALGASRLPELRSDRARQQHASELDWRPVEAHCRALGRTSASYHYDGVKGFKAGALNIALELTDPEATFIGVIDSDYQVSPDWLKTVVPAFADPQVALVQAPQDYRDADESLLKKCCYEEYRGFFHVGMVERDEHNAIIQHGTMCMVRRTALVGSRRLGAVVHHRRYRTRPAPVRSRLHCALHAEVAGSRPDAGHLRGVQGPALSLGVRRDADPEAPRTDVVRSRGKADARAALPLRRRAGCRGSPTHLR